MKAVAAAKKWFAGRVTRNRLDAHADQMSRQHKVPAHKRIGLQKYYLHAVKRLRMKAEDIASEKRGSGHNTAIIQFNKQQGGKFGVYVAV